MTSEGPRRENGYLKWGGIAALEQKKRPRRGHLRGRLISRGILDRADLLCGRALGALHDVELHALALTQGLESFHVDGGVMDEDILRTVIQADETETLGVVEPLHSTLCHVRAAPSSNLGMIARDLLLPLRAWRTLLQQPAATPANAG